MISQEEKAPRIQVIIVSSCLFPLFFYAVVFATPKWAPVLVGAQSVGGIVALTVFFFLINKHLSPGAIFFWLLPAVSPLIVLLCFFLWTATFDPSQFILVFWGIQFLFPAFHILHEIRNRKTLFRNLLSCVYVFTLALGCTILLFGKKCRFEFFPLAALSGILLELSFLRPDKETGQVERKS